MPHASYGETEFSIIDLAITSSLFTEIFFQIAKANNACGIVIEKAPVATLKKGSINYAISGGPFAVGIGILMATISGTFAFPVLGTVGGAALTTYGLIQGYIELRQMLISTRKDKQDTQLDLEKGRLEIERLKLELEKQRLEMEKERQHESRIIVPYSSKIDRKVIQEYSQRNDVSETYSNHMLNRTGPSYSNLAGNLDNPF